MVTAGPCCSAMTSALVAHLVGVLVVMAARVFEGLLVHGAPRGELGRAAVDESAWVTAARRSIEPWEAKWRAMAS